MVDRVHEARGASSRSDGGSVPSSGTDQAYGIQLTVMSIDFDSFEEPVTKVFSQESITIGRTEQNDLVLNRPEISGHHATLAIRFENGEPGVVVIDQGSSNGTLLERDQIPANTPILVQPNQRLIIGSYLLKPSAVLVDRPARIEVERVVDDQDSRRTRVMSRFAAPAPEEEFESAAELPVDLISTQRMTAVAEEPARRPHAAAQSGLTSPREGMENRGGIVSALAQDAHLTFALDGEHLLDLHFEARELLEIKGRVVRQGTPISGVTVDAGELGKAETDADGRFVFAGVPEGTPYRITVAKAGYVLEPSDFIGELTSRLEVRSNATALHRIAGRVERRGEPLAGVRVDAGSLGSATTDDNGSFVFADVREGTSYELKLAKDRYLLDPQHFSGSVSGDTNFSTAARKLLTVGGRILHHGQPLSNVEVECSRFGSVRTDSNGMYAFENIPEGEEYTLAARKEGYVFHSSGKSDA